MPRTPLGRVTTTPRGGKVPDSKSIRGDVVKCTPREYKIEGLVYVHQMNQNIQTGDDESGGRGLFTTLTGLQTKHLRLTMEKLKKET